MISTISVQSFRVIGKFLKKYRFFGILPVFWKNARNSYMIFGFYDQNYLIPVSFMEIGQFFSFGPKPVRTLSIIFDLTGDHHQIIALWWFFRNSVFFNWKRYYWTTRVKTKWWGALGAMKFRLLKWFWQISNIYLIITCSKIYWPNYGRNTVKDVLLEGRNFFIVHYKWWYLIASNSHESWSQFESLNFRLYKKRNAWLF